MGLGTARHGNQRMLGNYIVIGVRVGAAGDPDGNEFRGLRPGAPDLGFNAVSCERCAGPVS